VLLEGFVGDAARLAVHVTASGGELAVFLQHSRLEGTVAGGVELAIPGLAPATALVVPGLDVTASTFDSARASALRVLNPGEAQAVLSVELWGPDGPATLPGLEQAAVGPGLVSDLSLAGLPAGRYTAVVASDQPVAVAGLSLRSGDSGGSGGSADSGDSGEGEEPEEFAWSSSEAPSARGVVALPGKDLVARLVAGAEEASSLTVTPVGEDGERGSAIRLPVPARTSVALDVADLGAGGTDAALEFAWDGPAGHVALVVEAADSGGISVLSARGRWAEATEVAAYPLTP
jgi:hypothetical protein